MKNLIQFAILLSISLVCCKSNEKKEDQFFDLISDFEYDYLTYHNNKYFEIKKEDNNGTASSNLINKNGDVLLKKWYYQIEPYSNNSDALFVRESKENKFFALISRVEEQITDFKFLNPTFSETLPSVQIEEEGSYGSIDSTGKVIINFAYDRPFIFQKNQAIVLENGQAKLINEQNEVIDKNPFLYSQIKGLGNYSFYSNDGIDFGIRNRNDEIICEPKFKAEIFSTFNEFGYSIVKSENGNSIIDTTGKLILTTSTKIKSVFEDKLAMILNSNDEFQLINFKGDAIFDTKFDNYYEKLCTKDNLLIVSKNKKFGIIDLMGNVIVDFNYTNIISLESNYFAIFKENKYALAKIKKNMKPVNKLPKVLYTN